MPHQHLAAFAGWNEKLAAVLAERDRGRIPARLAQALWELLPFDSLMLAVMGPSIRPVEIYDDVPEELRQANVESYWEGAYLLDPFYRAGIEGRKAGVYRLSELAPRGFRQSEYFRIYYKECGNVDEVGSLTYLDGGLFLIGSYTQFHGSPNFRQAHVDRLQAALPVIDQVMRSYWEKGHEEVHRSTSLHTDLEAALGLFGNSVLTLRECEVIRHYLQGHSSKSVSDRMNISNHTVSMHRKNAYAKLDIHSQAELFHLFIDSLSCFDPVDQRDPLERYMSPPASGL